MNLSGAAARWVQSLDHRGRRLSWTHFSKLVLERFGKSQYEALIRKLFRIRQSTSVQEYIDNFAELVDQLLAYSCNIDPVFFAMRFMDGLRDDIRSAVHMQRPSSFDEACVLALLQEELLDSTRRKEGRRPEAFTPNKFVGARNNVVQTPVTADKNDKAAPAAGTERRGRGVEDRLNTLRSYRRARGLCIHCGEKWSRDHRCSENIQLHVLQEFWDICHNEANSDDSQPDEELAEAQVLLAVSLAALNGNTTASTMEFQGEIQGLPVKILLDSGSSHTFVSLALSSKLTGQTPLVVPLRVKIADGQILDCVDNFLQLEWAVQGCSFRTDAKVLPLAHYDMVVGMDWLAQYSPIQVDWAHKWLVIPYEGAARALQGELHSLPPGSVIQVSAVSDECNTSVPSDRPPAITQLLQEFQSVFEPPQGYPPERAFAHDIPLIPGATPVNVRPYRYPPAIKDEIERQISEMLNSGIVQPSQSPFSSSVLLVKKKDGTYRFCVDFRHLNAITVKTKYPVPMIEELLDELHGASWFSSLDLTAGYHQIRLKPGEEPKTAFQTHTGQYEFRVMAFGLTGAPATFLKAMNITLGPLLRKCVLVFFDDILIFSRTLAEHVEHVRLVLQLLQRDKWQVKLSKCVFAQRQLRYLGHIISEQGVATDPEKVQAVLQWPTPTSVKELRSFLGLAGYYRRFVRHFGMLSRPLTDLLKKGALFVWTEVQEQSFSALKQALTSAPVLAMPNFSKPFVIETDASGTGVGAVLMQQGHPLAFLSKSLSPRLQGLSTYEKEYLAILMAVEQWHSYLQLAEFQILTDHKSLVQLEEQRLHTPWQQKVFTRLLGLQYRIVYKKGVDNGAADALSRAPAVQCAAISISQPQWLVDVLQSYENDPMAQELLTKLADTSVPTPNYTLQSGLIRYKGRLWIGNDAALRLKLLQAMHASAVGGHSGVPVTYRRAKQHFYWPGLKSAVHTLVSECQICQRAKPDRSKLPGLLQPLPVPERAWKVLFVSGFRGGITLV